MSNLTTKKYIVEGMSCSACSASVERVVNKINGVKNASVNLTTKILRVQAENGVTDETIIKAVSKAGFTATIYTENYFSEKDNSLKNLLISLIFLLPLLYITMFKNVFIQPSFLAGKENIILNVLVQLLLTIPVYVIGKKYFINGFSKLFKRSPNMDSLVAIGCASSFLYGLFSFIMVIIGTINNNTLIIDNYAGHSYFESGVMIITIVSLGKYLESKSKKKTHRAIESLKNLTPKTATVLKDGKEEILDIDLVFEQDVIVIKEGESISCDGVIIDGQCEIDESSITGESLPVFKSVDSKVISGTILVSGYIKVKVTAVKEDTLISKIIEYVENAESTKAPIQRYADKISGIFVPIVMALSVITLIVWLIAGEAFDFCLLRAVSVLVVSCPCALGLATPVAITVATGKCAKCGILVKDALTLEALDNIKTVIFDKTGTITTGDIKVVDIYNLDNNTLNICSRIESLSSHPLAKAIVKYNDNFESCSVQNFKSTIGYGVEGFVNNALYKIGSYNFVKQDNFSKQLLEKFNEYKESGKTILFVSKDGEVLGFYVLTDEIKENAKVLIEYLKRQNIKSVLLSGDNIGVTNLTKEILNIDEAYGEVLPNDKALKVEEYNRDGKTMFIGDGINDSPALTKATIGVSVQSGKDIAIDSSDIVLLKDDILKVEKALKIGSKTVKIIKQNLFWALIYNVLTIPVAMGVLVPLGIVLSPILSSICMSLSSLFVVTNALRLYIME